MTEAEMGEDRRPAGGCLMVSQSLFFDKADRVVVAPFGYGVSMIDISEGRTMNVLPHSGVVVSAVPVGQSYLDWSNGTREKPYQPKDDRTSFFASLDMSNTVRIWKKKKQSRSKEKLTRKRKSEETYSEKRLLSGWRCVARISLQELKPNQSVDGKNKDREISEIASRRCITAIHSVPESSETRASGTLRLILVISVSVSVEDSTTKEEKRQAVPFEETLVEVVELGLTEVDPGSSTVVISSTESLFVCGHESAALGHNLKGKSKQPAICSAIDPLHGRFIAVSVDKHLTVWDRSSNMLLTIPYTQTFSSLAFSPRGDLLAAGDVQGRVLWWSVAKSSIFHSEVELRNNRREEQPAGEGGPSRQGRHKHSLSNRATLISAEGSFRREVELVQLARKGEKKGAVPFGRNILVQVSTSHWHAHAVRALCFTPDGLWLISGGEEGVLVFWNSVLTSRQFMPRFGAPILGVWTGSDGLAAVTLADNSLKIVDILSQSVVSLFKGVHCPLCILKPSSLRQVALAKRFRERLPLSMQPLVSSASLEDSRFIITGSGVTHSGIGANSVVQIYDVVRDMSLGTICVNKQNFISRVDGRLKRTQWTIQQVAFSSDGRRMATIERRRSTFVSQRSQSAISQETGMLSQQPGVPTTDYLEVNACPDIKFPMNNEARIADAGVLEVKRRRLNNREIFFTDSASKPTFFSSQLFDSGDLFMMRFWDVPSSSDSDEVKSSKYFANALLVNVIEMPHVHDVTALISIPSPTGTDEWDFISASLDGSWRIWRRKENGYSCAKTLTFRTLPITSARFSADESLLATAHASCVSLWRKDTLAGVLPIPFPSDEPRNQPPRSLPQIAWIECVDTPTGELVGATLLLVAAGEVLALYNLRLSTTPLVWTHRLAKDDYGSPPIVLSRSWKLPLFIVARPELRQFTLWKAKANPSYNPEQPSSRTEGFAGHEVTSGSNATTFTCEPVRTFYSLHSVLGCSLAGSAKKPKLAWIDAEFCIGQETLDEMSLEEVSKQQEEEYSQYTQDTASTAISPSEQQEDPIMDETSNYDDNAIDMSAEKDAEEEARMTTEPRCSQQLDETHFLSTYLKRTAPSSALHSYGAHQAPHLVGLTPDAASHLLPLPSTLFPRLLNAYGS